MGGFAGHFTTSTLQLVFFGIQGCGGGEVSGGGTHYMQWGADNCNCHKRGLWGERIQDEKIKILFRKYNIL